MPLTMKKTSCALVVFLGLSVGSVQSDDMTSIVPLPRRIVSGTGVFVLDRDFHVRVVGHRDPRLQDAIDRFMTRLGKLTGIHRFSNEGGATLEVVCERDGETPESYVLDVSEQGARLEADTVVGILRGLETMLQLVRVSDQGFAVPSVRIEDEPRFPWRGLLIDVSRHFQPLDAIKRNLDAMAAVKLNVLHWHLTDDQGFRIESKRFPKLHLLGSAGEYYTQDEIREVVAYANARGIRVVPELDVPGHATSWLVGFPELGSAPGPYDIETVYGIRDPALDPTREEVYRFLDVFFGEMAGLFPDPYVHIGGDEVTGKHWDENPAIQRFMEEHGLPDNHALQAYFNERVSRILAKYDKRMIGWDEILHPDLPAGTLVQSWRGQASLAEAARSGFDGILSFGYYLDHMFPASFHAGVDPVADGLTEREQARILGGEACMWGELITSENIDGRIWPRAGAVAERLWSSDSSEDVGDLYVRLARLSRYLDQMGLQHESSRRRMLARLAGEHAVEPLATLADVLEPVRFYARTQIRTYETDTPLNRLVDAVRPESLVARHFAALRNDDEIRTWLELWQGNHARLQPLLADSLPLHEVAPLSEDLSRLASVGLEALEFLERQERPPAAWVTEARRELESAAGPDFTVSRHMETTGRWPAPGTWWSDDKTSRKRAELEIMVVPAIARLVERAASR